MSCCVTWRALILTRQSGFEKEEPCKEKNSPENATFIAFCTHPWDNTVSTNTKYTVYLPNEA